MKKLFISTILGLLGLFAFGQTTTTTITTSGTWTCPAGVTSINVQCWGAGGGGGGGGSAKKYGGGGGGGGGYRINSAVTVVPGTVYNITVGTGGAGGTGGGATGSGGNGGATIATFGATIVSATGGIGGNNYASGADGGAGGTGTYSGGLGANGSESLSGGGGGGAGTTGAGNAASGVTAGALKDLNGGAGGNGNTSNSAPGFAGNNYGGGGGGGTKTSNGGDGAPGLVTITYTPPVTYCVPSGSSSYFIDDFSTTGGLTNITNNNTGSSASGYASYTGMSATQVPGGTVNFSISNDGGSNTYGFSIWIDWNQDNDFADAGEQVFVTSSYATSTSGSFTVPMTAAIGCTRMRVTANYLSTAPSNPCATSISGEFEDYTFCVNSLSACSGIPAPGNTVSSANPVCPSVSFTLSTSTAMPFSGITYQWQSSPDNSTWTNIAGATSSTYTGTQAANTYYRCLVTCTNGGAFTYSTALLQVTSPFTSCFCTSSATSTSDMDITSVNFGTINNTSATVSLTGSQGNATGTAGMYSDWRSSTVPVPSFMQGSTNSFSVTIGGTAYSHQVVVYIDFNHNGSLSDAGESFTAFAYANPTLPNSSTISINIPITALTGNTLMRVVCVESTTVSSCGTYTWGETEDYIINITAAVACSGTPVGGTANGSITSGCSGYTSVLSVTGATIATGLTYQWYSAPAAGGPWTAIPGATSETYTATVTSSLYYQRITTCTASGNSGTSTSVQLTVNSFLLCYCTSSATSTSDMDITNITFGNIDNTSATVSLTGTQGIATGTAGMYSDWRSSTVPVPSFMQGSTNTFSVTIDGTAYSHQVAVYIDFNHNGVFTDAGENFTAFAYANPSLPNTSSLSITIPISALTGNTVMRVVCVESSTVNSCGTYTWGETEDYIINITLATPCSGVPTGGTAAASSSSCGNIGGIYVTGSTIASGLTYQWYSAPAAAGPWSPIAGATGETYTPVVSGLYYKRLITCTASGDDAYSSSMQYVTTAPSNDECVNATPLTVNPNLVCTSVTAGTVLCASASSEANSCYGTADDDVWFSFVATSTSHTISLLNVAGSTTDMYHSVYSGTCGSLTNLKCSDADESTATGLTIGATYYVRVYTYGSTSGQTTTFNVCVKTPPSGGISVVGSSTCENAVAFCASNDSPGVDFEITDDDVEYPVGQCSFMQNPSWWYMQISQNGDLDMTIASSCGDVDFACYGPFDNITCDPTDLTNLSPLNYFSGSTIANHHITYNPTSAATTSSTEIPLCVTGALSEPSGNLVDFGGSTSHEEYLQIRNAVVGEYYIVLIGNYAQCAGTVSFNQTNLGAPGSGTVDCDIVTQCNITSITANTTVTGATYTVSGNINFIDPPDSGTLTICDGTTCQTFTAPFTSPQAYSLSGLIPDGLQHQLTATFTSATVNCDKISNYTSPPSTLPVTLLNLNANCRNSAAAISWQTASETNNDYFVIEKRNSNNELYEIGRIDGAGNSNSLIDYLFFDENLLQGNNYYRLSQIDFDGTTTVYPTISVNCDNYTKVLPTMHAYPNPFADEVNVVIQNLDEGEFTLEIINELGKVVYQKKYIASKSEFQTLLNLYNLQPAVYNLQCRSQKNVLTIRVIKK